MHLQCLIISDIELIDAFLFLLYRSFKKEHEFRALVGLGLLQDLYLVSAGSFLSVVDDVAAVHKVSLLIWWNVVLATVPYEACVFLAVFVIWLSLGAQN